MLIMKIVIIKEAFFPQIDLCNECMNPTKIFYRTQ